MRKKRDWIKNPPITCPERMAFLLHRIGAPKRGIDFNFTYQEWTASPCGPDWFKKRGNKTGQYVMARHGDKGPYEPGNVKCITSSENIREGVGIKNRGNAKLTHAEVGAIYLALKTGRCEVMAKLAREYGVSAIAIRDIKNKMTWSHVTDLLD